MSTKSLTVLALKSLQQLTSPRPHWCSPTSPWTYGPFHMQLPMPSDCGRTAAWLIWAHSNRYHPAWSYWSAMPKTSQILASTKVRSPPRFHWFSSNYSTVARISASKRPIKKPWNLKIVRPAFSVKCHPPQPRVWGPHRDPMLRTLSVPLGKGCRGSERGGGKTRNRSYLVQVRNSRRQTRHPTVLAINPPPPSFPLGLSFVFLLAACETLLRLKNSIKMILTVLISGL